MLSTIGSLGDLYPVLSIARALEDRGTEVRLALTPEDCDIARRWGLLATPVGPSQADVCAALGMSRDEVAASVLQDPGPLISQALMPLLPDMARTIATLCDGATCVAGTSFALGAALAAEMTDLPFVPLILQPMMLMSAEDPAHGHAHRFALHDRTGPLAHLWNRAFIGAVHGVFRLRHGRQLSRVRRDLGLNRQRATPILDHDATMPVRLGLWSEHFAPKPKDAPEGLHLVGFPPAPEGDLPAEVVGWIAEGPPPLVVTLGSIAQRLGRENFWRQAIDMARQMGLRAVLLHGAAEVPQGLDILALPYAAHAPLFPMAAAVVHHGGIGSTAEAMRAGRPQLILPVGGDQPDNAMRVKRAGLAEVIPIAAFTGQRGAAELGSLLNRFDYAKAAALADTITEEDGAAIAARHLQDIALRA
ncbi:glycosyltransferase [Jannaschia sp. 2305UL9-9]|uniref:glycosyltransferase n=1 Tax=Jannaschia sp. 2305UL9-9 TaxID=3121638 RepID=UPI003527B03D